MTFKSTRRGFIISASVIALLHLFFGISLWWLALPAKAPVLGAAYGIQSVLSSLTFRSFPRAAWECS